MTEIILETAAASVDLTESFGIEECAQICEGLAWIYQSGGGGPVHERFWQAARKIRNRERWTLGRYLEDGTVIDVTPLADNAAVSKGEQAK